MIVALLIPRHKSSPVCIQSWANYSMKHLYTFNCIEKTKKRKNRPRMTHFLKEKKQIVVVVAQQSLWTPLIPSLYPVVAKYFTENCWKEGSKE